MLEDVQDDEMILPGIEESQENTILPGIETEESTLLPGIGTEEKYDLQKIQYE